MISLKRLAVEWISPQLPRITSHQRIFPLPFYWKPPLNDTPGWHKFSDTHRLGANNQQRCYYPNHPGSVTNVAERFSVIHLKPREVTHLLADWSGGDKAALAELLPTAGSTAY